MGRPLRGVLWLGAGVFALADAVLVTQDIALETPQVVNTEQTTETHLRAARSTLTFEENRGQVDPRVRYLARAANATVYLTDEGATLASPARRHGQAATTLALRVEHARRVVPEASGELQTRANYFRGSDPSTWRTDVPTFARVTYPSIVEGVDWVFHGEAGALEHDFVVAPGARVDGVVVEVRGADALSTNAAGDLVVRAGESTVVQARPRVYQTIEGRERPITAAYRIKDASRVGFEVAAYDPARELVIDPAIAYATYLGGTRDDQALAIAVDSNGNAYVTGTTSSLDFPASNDLVPRGSPQGEVFVTKIAADDSSLLYSTYLGGRAEDAPFSVAVDAAGEAFVAGETDSPDFPVRQAAFPWAKGDAGCPAHSGFLTKLSASGSAIVYSTYLGGSGDDQARGVAVDPQGNAYVAGWTSSPDYPTTRSLTPFVRIDGGVYGSGQHAFVAALPPQGIPAVYSTVLGGSGDDNANAIAVDAQGDAFVTGATSSPDFPASHSLLPEAGGADAGSEGAHAFVVEIAPGGASIVQSTVLGGTGSDVGTGIALDGAGDAFLVGYTTSLDFPTQNALFATATPGSEPSFVAKLSASGLSLVYATYLTAGSAIAADSQGNAYVGGTSVEGNFPVVDPLPDSSPNVMGKYNGVIAELDPNGTSFVFATYLGDGMASEGMDQQLNAIALGAQGDVYVAGSTQWTQFPVQRALCPSVPIGGNAFVARISPTAVDLGGPLSAAPVCKPSGTPVTGGRGVVTGCPPPGTVDNVASCHCALVRPARTPPEVWLLLPLAAIAARLRRRLCRSERTNGGHRALDAVPVDRRETLRGPPRRPRAADRPQGLGPRPRPLGDDDGLR